MPLVNQITENWHQNQGTSTSLETWLNINATMDSPLVAMKLQDARFMGIGVIRHLHASVSWTFAASNCTCYIFCKKNSVRDSFMGC